MDYKRIIKEQREELEMMSSTQHIIKRTGLQTASAFLNHPNIIAVLGVRRSGKSVFSYLLGKDRNFGYINFDDERIKDMEASDLNRVLEAFYELYGDPEIISTQ